MAAECEQCNGSSDEEAETAEVASESSESDEEAQYVGDDSDPGGCAEAMSHIG